MNMLELKLLLRALDRETMRDLQSMNDDRPTLTPAETMVIGIVAKEGPLPIGAIVEATGFAQSYVSSVIMRLETAGYVQSARDPQDRRRTVVRLEARMQDQISDSLTLDVRPMFARILGDTEEETPDSVIRMFELLAQRLDSTAEFPTLIHASRPAGER